MEKIATDLQTLADPALQTEPIDLGNSPTEGITKYLRLMLTIRAAEEAIAQLVLSHEAVCPCHLGIGQEAIAVGVSANLGASDRVFGAHRSHSHYLALGGDLNALMAEVLGKETGCSRGMGGSMHLYGASVGFHGSVPIVAGTIPIAVGAALACKLDGAGKIAVSYFGDGAAEEGVVHESLNLASVHKLPVLFVCENNFYASHLDIALRQPSDRVSRFADAHRVTARLVDGNDVVAVAAAANDLIERARQGEGPGFLEAITYRWCGHVGPDENIDVGVRRHIEDLTAWKRRDPVGRLWAAMRTRVPADLFDRLQAETRKAVADAVSAARAAPYPETDALLDRVYYTNGKKGK